MVLSKLVIDSTAESAEDRYLLHMLIEEQLHKDIQRDKVLMEFAREMQL